MGMWWMSGGMVRLSNEGDSSRLEQLARTGTADVAFHQWVARSSRFRGRQIFLRR